MQLLDTARRTAGATMVIATHDPAVTEVVVQVVDVDAGRLSARARRATVDGGPS